MPTIRIESPLGPLFLTEEAGALTALSWQARPCDGGSALLEDAGAQLAAYFAGARRDFHLPMRVEASDLVQAVCAEMRAIPFGETRTYGQIASALGRPPQAIGQACGANPLPLLIPCHRVLGASGLGGFSGDGGVETKVQLLKHEGAASLLI
ncbi:methylated-DNA--[protein]-cysteine S-methyltransferase [Pseudooceanicola algae]|uniref:Methylated-DNA--protein-cysteine methyltransferase, constitutive n=1 Tax=Pseudooceanicola algae TaxID=1537215 RepID=A0A418SJ85_9RHOB|nr:methylated-DNA--[protein]-cysteine S-methyltransferase [Pseudooceanicola algae]QPM90161.1 Methylated-DNA--protein-cysteine methyltransferase, constitutive [Pseudooceanicola algae]